LVCGRLQLRNPVFRKWTVCRGTSRLQPSGLSFPKMLHMYIPLGSWFLINNLPQCLVVTAFRGFEKGRVTRSLISTLYVSNSCGSRVRWLRCSYYNTTWVVRSGSDCNNELYELRCQEPLILPYTWDKDYLDRYLVCLSPGEFRFAVSLFCCCHGSLSYT
jgi:hypothetical protein